MTATEPSAPIPRRPAIFFDRDNTLIASDGYLGDPDRVVLVDGAADAVARARALGYVTVVFSNQSGVARGLFDEAAVQAVNARLDAMLLEQNPAAVIDHHEYCPFHPEGVIEQYRRDSELRKPRPGMIHRAAEKLSLDLSKSWAVGDAPRDIEAGHAAGCRTVLFLDPALPLSPAAHAPRRVAPDFEVPTLGQAIDRIERHRDDPPTPAAVNTAPDPDDSFDDDDDADDSSAPARSDLRSTIPPAAPDSPAIADSPASPRVDLTRVESLLRQLIDDTRRRDQHAVSDFSVSRLLAGIVQVLALAALFVAYLQRDQSAALQSTLLLALMLQTLTIALLIMGKQK